MTAVFLFVKRMERCFVGPGWTGSMFVFFGVCLNLKLLFVFDVVRMRSLTHPDVLSKYTNMAMAVVRSYSSNTWDGVVLALTNRKYVCIIGELLNLKLLSVFNAVWGRNFTLCVQIHYNGDDDWLCGYVCLLNVWNGDILDLREQLVRSYWHVLEFEAIVCIKWSMRASSHPNVNYNNGDDGCAFVFAECMYGTWNGGTWPFSKRKYGVLVFLNLKLLFVFNDCSTYEVVISLYVLSKYTKMAMAAVRLFSLNLWHGVVLALDKQAVRWYWCALEFEVVIRVRCSMMS